MPYPLSTIRSAFACFDQSGNEMRFGDTIVDFRGDNGTFGGITRPPVSGKAGKISVDGREVYDKVYNLETKLRDPEHWIAKAEAYGGRIEERQFEWVCQHPSVGGEYGNTKAEAAFWFCAEHDL